MPGSTCTRAPGDLAREALGARDRRERVVLAPQRQERHAEGRQPAVVGLELGELAAAVELELAAAARLVGERLEVLAGVVGADPARDRAEHGGEAVERHPVDELLSLLGRAQRVGHAVPAAVGEEAGVRGHDRPDRVRMVTRPAQADQPAPVVADERHAVEPLGGAQRLERLDVARPGVGPGRPGLGVAEAGQVGRDRVEPALGERVQRRSPHVRGRRIAVDEQHGRIRGIACAPEDWKAHLH